MNDNNEILSQEEIDALMNNVKNNDEEEKQLTAEEKDALGEIGNIAMGSAATALYTMLDQKVEITAPEVNVSKFSKITEEYTRPCVLIKVEYVAGVEGVNLLIIKEEDAQIIADLMMGGDGSNTGGELDEIHLSAVGEAMNQMMGSASTALSSIISEMVNISPPEAEYIDLHEAIDNDEEFFDSDDILVDTSFRLKIGDLVDSRFKQLAPLPFTKKLVATLTDAESGGLTAKDQVNTDDSQAAATTEEELVSKPREQQQEPQQPQQQQPAAAGMASPGTHPQPSTGNVKHQQQVEVQRAQFPDFDGGTTAPLPQNMELIKDVPLQVTVRLGKSKMTIKDILDLGEGSIVELDKLAGEPVDLLVNGKLVAKGEVVVIDENFGFRVKDIISPMERINNL